MHKFYIRNNKGQGLQHTQGSIYWRYPKSFEEIDNFTHFSSVREAAFFIKERNIDSAKIGKITVTLEIVK